MLDEFIHYKEVIDEAEKLISHHFQKSIHFSEIVQLNEPDSRNIVLRLLIDKPQRIMPESLILKKTTINKKIFDTSSNDETEVEKMSRFAREWAGLEFLTSIGSTRAPYFYAGSLEHKFILTEDLGVTH